MVVDMESKLKKWQQKLLDLGRKNPNLNFKFNKTSNLKIEAPDIYTLWMDFVVNEKDQSFGKDIVVGQGLFERTEEILQENIVPNSSSKKLLKTNQPLSNQFKILRNLRKKAKTFEEEQGVNVLQLGFGFLHYAEGSDYYDAPLILVPVKLINESINDSYDLELGEDEILVNPTLCYKLQNDYGINLPEYTETKSLQCFFEEVRKCISDTNWEIYENIGLAIFSFAKISMYKDLEAHREGIIGSGLIQTIGGSTEAELVGIPTFGSLDEEELLKPENNLQVVDADSSQQEAILCAKNGVSFVLQGPPGTGKSQTITNIIAECLGAGKKVLFVSEKMAALEVVHKRLKEAQLDDFCLIMHNHKENKKFILSQFENVLKLAEKKLSLKNEALEKLKRLEQDKLEVNNYAEAIYKNIEPLNSTIFEINGKIAELQDAKDLMFSIEDVRHISNQRLYTLHGMVNKFARCIENAQGNVKNSPWYGCNIAYLGHEVIQDLNVYLECLIKSFEQLQKERASVYESLKYDFKNTYQGVVDAAKVLELAVQAKAVPTSWILDTDLAPLTDEIAACNETKTKFLEIRERIINLHQELKTADSALDFTDYNVLSNLNFIDAHKHYIESIIAKDALYSSLSTESNIDVIDNELRFLKKNVCEYKGISDRLTEKFEKEILYIPCNEILTRFKTEYTWGFFNFLKSSYRKDKKLFKGLLRNVGQSISDTEISEALVSLKRRDEIKEELGIRSSSFIKIFGESYKADDTNVDYIEKKVNIYKQIQLCINELDKLEIIVNANEEQEQELRAHYETLYSGIETDWDMVRKALGWAEAFKNIFADAQANKDFVEFVCGNSDTTGRLQDRLYTISNWINDIKSEYTWLKDKFDASEDFDSQDVNSLIARLKDCRDNIASLQNWIDYREAKKECCNSGLGSFVQAAEINDLAGNVLCDAFDKRFYKLWLDSIMPENPAVANFHGANHSAIVDEFKQLDRQQFDIAKLRIRNFLVNNLPSFDAMTSGKDEVGILRREMNKQRRIKPIRKLFGEIPNLVMMLKPCLMMSPLTVSLFLESDSFKFDTVIFDEASQVCTENAIGAILRAKQVIIAGDSKQLPPTNFFHAALTNSDYDEYDENDESNNDIYESLLDEAALLPSKMLLWHYRSRHEHLIVFSNAKIYNGNLVTFPTNKESGKDIGVEYEYVPAGYYDRGGRKGNVIEAEKVANMVFEHFDKCRLGKFNRSLGVITFGEIQALAVETALRLKRQQHPEYEEFFNEDLEEAFFVKSLENVQGDERDTIIFSIGYAKDNQGIMRMAFGPLSQTGGERRLNVAITRAKYNIKLVGSILPTDIDVDRISSSGPKLLRSYIDFAMRGVKALDSEVTDENVLRFDSPFEESVYNVLVKAGYDVRTQVGCSGYRIDLAVKHPEISGTYVLGIECDGASYHSAKTARERDRLRQDVLENMGWNIYRIWSTDWIKDPISEGRKLLQIVEDAILKYGCEIRNSQNDGGKEDLGGLVEEEEKESPIELQFAIFKAPSYNECSRRNKIKRTANEACLAKMIEETYPIHQDLLYLACLDYLDRTKVTAYVRDNVDAWLKNLERKGNVVKKNNFYYTKSYDKIPVREAGVRSIEQISIDELAEGMYAVAQGTVGISFDGLLQETANAFGFKRRGPKINEALGVAFDLLEKNEKIEMYDGKILVNI